MRDKWEYFEGEFVADRYNDTLLKYSPWSGHRRFGYDLVSYYEPENLVELGSFYGCSTFAFMQAIRKNQLSTKMYPVDLWEAGDKFTIHDYEQDVYGFFKKICESEFSDITVNMMKMTFDEAKSFFDDYSIDILHIDGSHAYEDVKHDYESWISKVKKDGIVLFHDVSEQLLYGKTLGSCIFWKELKEKYPFTAEMQHSWGLGILFLSEEKYRDFLNKVDMDYYLKMSTYDETIAKDRIRTDYFRLLDANKWIESLKHDKEAADQDNSRLLHEIDTIRENYKNTDKEKDMYAEELKRTIQKYKRMVEEKDAYAEELKVTIQGYEYTVEGKDAYVDELRGTIQKYEQTAESKDAYVGELKDTIRKYEDTFAGKDKYIKELLTTIEAYKQENQKIKEAYEQTIEAKDTYIEELQDTVQGYEDTFVGKDKYIEELLAAIEGYKQELSMTIEAYKKENQDIKAAYEQTVAGKDAYIEELESRRKIRR